MSTGQQQDTPKPAAATEASGATLDTAIGITASRQSLCASAAARLGVEPNKVCSVLRNFWSTSQGQPDLTDAELMVGMSLVARFGLDPAAREVYVTRDKRGRLLTIIGVDGWIKAMLSVPHYDGHETELGWSDDGKTLLWSETRIYSNRISRPTVYRGYKKEYDRVAGFVNKDMPSHMLRIFSLRHAVRLFTSLGSGVVMEDELDYINRHHGDKTHVPSGATESHIEQARQQRTYAPTVDGCVDQLEDLAVEIDATKPPPEPDPETQVDPAADDDLEMEIQSLAADYGEEMDNATTIKRLDELAAEAIDKAKDRLRAGKSGDDLFEKGPATE